MQGDFQRSNLQLNAASGDSRRLPAILQLCLLSSERGRILPDDPAVATLDDAIPALNPVERRKGKAVIHAHP